MSRDSSGNYTLPAGNPVVGGTVIEPTWANTTLNDIALALTESVNIQGTKAMVGPLKLPDGNLVAPALSFNSNADCGLFYTADSVQGTINGVVESVLSTKGLSLTSSFACADPLDNINKIDNSDFYFAQRAVSSSVTAYVMDRWLGFFQGTGSSQTVSQQAFTGTQTDVPGYPSFFARADVVGSSDATAQNILLQMIEDVSTFAGGKATVSFWARANAPKKLSVVFSQNYGTGSTAGDVVVPGALLDLTTVWQRFTVTVSIPALISSTNPAPNTRNFRLYFCFSAGATASPSFNGIPVQSGQFDISNVMMQKGELAGAYSKPTYQASLLRCQRFYEKSFPVTTLPAQSAGLTGSTYCPQIGLANNGGALPEVTFSARKRIAPTTIVTYNPNIASSQVQNLIRSLPCTSGAVNTISDRAFALNTQGPAGSAAGDVLAYHWTADAEFAL